MTDQKKCCVEPRSSERGNAVVVTLVILVAVAVGVLAIMSGKIGAPKSDDSLAVASTSDTPSDVQDAKTDTNPVLASLNGEEIKRQDVIDLVNIMPPQMKQIPLDKLFPMALEQLISNKIVDRNASKAGLERDESVKEQLANAKTQIIRAKFLENEIKSKLTEDRLKAEYDQYIKNFPDVDEVKVAHILVDDEAKAKALIKKLSKGAVFAELAKENSKDGSAENGGDLGYFSKTDVVPEFAAAAFATNAGEYTKAPVKTEFGFHIIKVDEKRKRPPAEFAQAKPYMEKELQRKILDEMLVAWKADTKIERFDINGKPLADQEPAAGVVEAAPVPAAATEAAADPKIVE